MIRAIILITAMHWRINGMIRLLFYRICNSQWKQLRCDVSLTRR